MKSENEILTCWKEWVNAPLEDPELKEELNRIGNNMQEIYDRFYKDLEFGTGGLRGVIGVGTNRINICTIGKVTQGYANYLTGREESPSVAIAYDSRINSELFARRTASVLAANGIRVYIYRELMPTPSLSFAVRHLQCSGGIVITASHNPAKYNGYKVYGSDGGQITTRIADEILQKINSVSMFKDVKTMEFEQGLNLGLISYIGDETVSAYIEAVSSQSLYGEYATCTDSKDVNKKDRTVQNAIAKDVSIVYTPLNGAGLACVLRTLKENGFTNITVVKEQEMPNGNFPTCPYPNPEMKEALTLGIEYAIRFGSELVLATDPDCDRVGTAVKSGNHYVLLSGNEMGLLLFDYICKRRISLGKMPDRPIVVKTIVTTDMVKKIAADYGVEVIDVLTGFKFIGEQISLLESRGEKERYIFGFEESYGYLTGGYVRDKDGVNGALLICEMFTYYKSLGLTLNEVLDSLYQKYGYCLNTLRSYVFEGADGFQKMTGIMDQLRKKPPIVLHNKAVKAVSDYRSSTTLWQDGRHGQIDLPKSNVLKFLLEENSSVVIRPSGTEPKLKVYISLSANSMEEARMCEENIVSELEKNYF